MRPLRFLLNGELRELADVDPTQTVLQWLRQDARLCGTKEGCAEGDCGACTVVVGKLDDNDQLAYRAVNACILFLPAIDGCELITVEHLKSADGELHPAQRALVECGGSQCGFCTPGFTMSLFAMYLDEVTMRDLGDPDIYQRPTRQRINDVLSGNLCRCTGYRSIVAAADAMLDYPWQDPTVAAMDDTAERLRALARDAEPLALERRGRRWFAPTSEAQLEALLGEYPDAVLLAGGTDVGLWVTKKHLDLATVIHLGHVPELQQFRDEPTRLVIGAGVTHNDAYLTIAHHFPDFGELLRRFASTPIRNSSTVGGNIANGSPIGDSMPVLIALGAEVVLKSAAERRAIALEDLYLDYGKQSRRPGEYVESVRIPKLAAGEQFRCYKLSKRFDQDVSAVCAAFKLRLDGGRVAEFRAGFGGVAAIPARARATEAALIGKPWDETRVAAAEAILGDEFSPLSDMRASADYRCRTTVNLLRKFYIETTQPEARTRVLAEANAT